MPTEIIVMATIAAALAVVAGVCADLYTPTGLFAYLSRAFQLSECL